MVKLLKLLRRVIIHKFWVAYYCFQLGLYWQGITHDLSKFSLTKIKGALKYWNGFKAEYGKAVPTLPENVTQIEVI